MEQIIRDMITYADERSAVENHNYNTKENILDFVKRILDLVGTLSETDHIPSRWLEIGNELANEWNNGDDNWKWDDTGYEDGSIYSCLELGDYGADECFGIAGS